MQLLFLYGPPAVGKLTIARELARLTGYPVFHNHLVVDALLAVFPFGSAEFVELRERFWVAVMESAAARGAAGLIFTFAPETSVVPGFAERVEAALRLTQSTVLFVSVTAPEDVIERRLLEASRRAHGKLASIDEYRELRLAGALDYGPLPCDISIDASVLLPADAAKAIARALKPS